jgi:hypothetical protein
MFDLKDFSFKGDLDYTTSTTIILLQEQGHLGIPLNQLKSLKALTRAEFNKGHLLKVLNVLILNPNDTLAWNSLKRFKTFDQHLYFALFLLTKYPKNTHAWMHLKWTLKTCTIVNLDYHILLERIERAADHVFCNYACWNFRFFLYLFLASSGLDYHSLELTKTRLWCKKHPNDHSGFHYLFQLLLHSSDSTKEFDAFMDFIRDQILFYGPHEALLYHYRSLFRFGLQKSLLSHQHLIQLQNILETVVDSSDETVSRVFLNRFKHSVASELSSRNFIQ